MRRGIVGIALLSAVLCVGPVGASTARWVVTSVPSPTIASSLTSVSCVESSFCVAVGGADARHTQGLLAERWDGAAWSPMSLPAIRGALTSVSCTSAATCVAVGLQETHAGSSTLALRWDGATWSELATPQIAGATFLNGVSCAAPTGCVAVGYSQLPGSNDVELSMAWDGTSWSVAAGPRGLPGFSVLQAVSCAKLNRCIAVGTHEGPSPLAQEWNGRRWTLMVLPTIGSTYGYDLNGVSCVSAGSCLAVGTVFEGSVRATALYAWDGTTWSGVLGPAPASYANVLTSVACFTRSRCIAGGFFSNVSPGGRAYTKTLIVGWNAGAVTLLRSPKLTERERQLFGVSCSERAFCMAVGATRTHRRSEPLALIRI